MTELIGVEMFKKAYNIYDKLLGEVAKENNLTLNQLKILMFLEKNRESNIAKNITEGLGATKSHISMSITGLEKEGYIERSQDESDKKKSRLQLTKKSLKIIEYGKKSQQKVKDIMFEGIEQEELKVLNDISKRIQENLKKYNSFGG